MFLPLYLFRLSFNYIIFVALFFDFFPLFRRSFFLLLSQFFYIFLFQIPFILLSFLPFLYLSPRQISYHSSHHFFRPNSNRFFFLFSSLILENILPAYFSFPICRGFFLSPIFLRSIFSLRVITVILHPQIFFPLPLSQSFFFLTFFFTFLRMPHPRLAVSCLSFFLSIYFVFLQSNLLSFISLDLFFLVSFIQHSFLSF